MPRFLAIVHKDPGSAFGVTFPEVPGCFAASDDEAGLPAAAREALALYFDLSDDAVIEVEFVRA
jgi:predicted RNase H-like HicB family nuclease